MQNSRTFIATIFAGFIAGFLGSMAAIGISGSSPQNLALFNAPRNSDNNVEAQNAGTPATAQENLVVQAVKKANPAVVAIVITADVPVIEQYYSNNPLREFFDFPFNLQLPQFRQNGTERREIGGGSGFLVSSDGLVVTNKHVVDQENAEYTVFTNDGKQHKAEVVARDPVNDLAILRIQGSNFPYLQFGNSDKLEVGQTAIAIGNALAEFRNTVSVGIVSGLSRSITAGSTSGQSEMLDNVIQTDAAINPGNSGGPLLDINGRVIGVNVAIVQGSQNIGFALPGKLAESVVSSVKQTGKISRPYLGVRYTHITPQIKQSEKLSVDYGALIIAGQSRGESAVIAGSPAAKAGIKERDIILEIDGTKLADENSLASVIRQKKVGDTITLKILRNGTETTSKVQLEEMPQ